MEGSAIGFFGGSTTRFLDDMQVLKPTIVAAVPWVLEMIITKVCKQFSIL